ncbi:MAG: hypothetical protein ACI4JW_10505 [Oscillospiraceae bacterium]
MHIISAQICELGLTLAQRCTDDKSNEIPAVQELLKELKIIARIFYFSIPKKAPMQALQSCVS